LLTVRMALGLAWIRRTTREHQHHDACEATLTSLARRFGVTRRVGLRVVDDLASPLSVGWLRPLVLVPAALLSGMPPQLLEALLAHEMAHIRRLDYLVNLGQNVIETLLFYHPAVWWISHRIRHEREQIADDLAASCTGDKRNLALALSELETMQFGQHHLAQAANGGQLLERVRRLVRPATAMPDWKAALAVMGLVAACLSVAAHASVGPHAAVPDHMPMADFGSCGKPVWPSAALAERRTGMVSLGFEIGEDGRVTNSFVRKSSGSADLDEAARAGIALCHFHPGTVRGTPVSSWTAIQYQWLL
ncbi:MAG: TonB family protein, partial [Massilia sp.]